MANILKTDIIFSTLCKLRNIDGPNARQKSDQIYGNPVYISYPHQDYFAKTIMIQLNSIYPNHEKFSYFILIISLFGLDLMIPPKGYGGIL